MRSNKKKVIEKKYALYCLSSNNANVYMSQSYNNYCYKLLLINDNNNKKPVIKTLNNNC